MQLLDLTGRELFRPLAPSAATDIPVRHLSPGVYLLRVQYAQSTVTRRIVVE